MRNLSNKEMANMINNCRKATFLIEKQQQDGITEKEEAELEYHLNTCEICRIFEKQSSQISQFVKKMFRSENNELKLEDSFKKELQKQINARLD